MTDRNIVVYARNSTLGYEAQIDFFESLQWVDIYNPSDGAGGWILNLNEADLATDYLRLPGSGITIVVDDTVAFSGQTKKIERTQNADVSQYVFSGVDDSGLLHDRQAHPQPGTSAPPYSVSAYDTRTGVCSTVLRAYVNANLGVGATSGRYDFRVSLAADPAIGSMVTGNGRWQQLDTLLNELATQSTTPVGYRIRQNGVNLEFQTFAPTDRTSNIIFSVDNGTLQDYGYTSEAGSGNYVYVGGGGEGTARTIREGFDGDSIVRWGRRELFKDQRDTTDPTTLANSITEELANGSDLASVTFTPKDIPQQTYWTHYQPGDKVTVVIDGVSFQEQIRQVECRLDSNGLTVTPTVATPNNTASLKLYDQLSAQNRRLRNLERR
jgi:hypothetical protein